MIDIKEGKELILENVLSFRKKMTQDQMEIEMVRIRQVIQKLGLCKEGGVVTTTYGFDMIGNEQVLDSEILIPLNKQVKLPEEYELKKKFVLKNAIYVRCEGNPINLDNKIEEMLNYIKKKNMQQITGVYSVQMKDIKSLEEIDEMVIDCYIGISENVL